MTVNRARFALELVDKLIAAAGPYRIAIRLSSQAYINLDYTPGSAENEINEQRIDLVAFGRPFIANPDRLSLIRNNKEPLPYDESLLQSLR